MSTFFGASAATFARSCLRGPFVKIKLKSSSLEYTVSKDLLCKESTYFASMFKNNFKESEEQLAILREMKGVVSTRSVEALLQWLYTRRVEFEETSPEDETSAALEVARLADMCEMKALGRDMAEHISWTLRDMPRTEEGQFDVETCCLTSKHVRSARHLPRGNEVRRVIVLVLAQIWAQDWNSPKFIDVKMESRMLTEEVFKERVRQIQNRAIQVQMQLNELLQA